jgi:hypothetical protein
MGGFKYNVRVRRDGEIVSERTVFNETPDEFMNYFLGCLANNISRKSAYYVALMGTSTTPSSASTYVSTMSSANYESVDYSESTRPEWTPGSAGDPGLMQISNATTAAEFNMLGNDTTINGLMIVSSSAKDDNSSGPILLSVAEFGTAITGITAGSTIEITGNFTIAGTTA